MRGLTVAVTIAAVLLTGCSDTSSDGGTTTTEVTSENTGEPAPEPTDPESTQTQQKQPTISIVSAPIGGNVQTDDLQRCAEVNWLGRNPIPDGTTIKLGSPSLDPDGVFEFYQAACSGDLRSCADVEWQSENFKPCYVGVRQIANAEEGIDRIDLVISVDATCATQDDCDSLAAGKGETQIRFRPDILPTPSGG